ncbi:MAG: EAL domain-containing protein [Rhodocyclaceae bacterium]|nr:EAL domain-containing protein [Rhodocyclaceae bacterium]
MSMYRQLWLAIIISTLLALGGSLLASLLSARAYLEEQLTMKNSDNAAALALSLSQQKPDLVTVELAVSALFDSGHYEAIRVVDPFGKLMIERVSPEGDLGVPEWFVRRLPIKAKPGEAQISSGWTQFGTVILVSHSRFAYTALWTSTKEMIGALALAGLVGGYLGSVILRRLRRPLQAVIEQAQAITDRRFTTIPEPDVPELRQLAIAMNTTVGRLKAMFEEEAARLENVRQEANCDPLTGLSNRDYFMARVRATLESEESAGGALMLIRVADLAGVNRRLGRAATDDLLRQVGKAANQCVCDHGDGLAARLNGADFALLLPDCAQASPVAQTLLQNLIHAAEPFVTEGPSAFIGFGSFPRGLELPALMAQVDAALAAAEADGVNGAREAIMACDEDAPKSADEWSRMIQNALNQRWVRLISFPVVRLDGSLLHRECPLRLMLDEHGEWLPAGRFLPMAERLKLTPRLDLAAIALGLEELDDKPALSGLAINLSASSVQDDDFRRQLAALLAAKPQAAARLWLEVAETGALHHFEAFRALCRDIKAAGSRLGLEHFGRQFSQVGLLHDLGLDYLKVDASFIRGLDGNPGNQAFLKGLSSIAQGIGLQVIAEGVVSDAEFKALAGVGFDGATGPAVKEPT